MADRARLTEEQVDQLRQTVWLLRSQMAAAGVVVACPNCSQPMQLRASVYGLFYGCPDWPGCNGTHGAHPDGCPLGIPAPKATRAARTAAHRAFDRLWSAPRPPMTRAGAYQALAQHFGLTKDEAHIARMDADQAYAVERWAIDEYAKVAQPMGPPGARCLCSLEDDYKFPCPLHGLDEED